MQVTYRGVPYNTEDDRQVCFMESAELTYRGVPYTKTFNHLSRIKRAMKKESAISKARAVFTKSMKEFEMI